jgi:hypothetical protein
VANPTFKSASNIEAGLSGELSENVCNAAYAAPRLTADITKAIAIRDLMNGMVFSSNADDQEENLALLFTTSNQVKMNSLSNKLRIKPSC